MSRFSRRHLISLAGGMTIAMIGLPAANARQSPTDFLPFLDGLEAAWARRYMAPGHHIPAATPATTSLEFLEVTVLEFESDETAKKARALLNTDMVLPALTGVEDISIDDFKDAGLGDRSHLFTDPETGDREGLLIVFDGELGFILTGHGSDDTMVDTMLAIGAFMVDAEPGTGEVDLAGAGQSAGGTWDVMPRTGDEVLAGLVSMYDYDLLVSNSPIEPEASPVS